MREPYERIAGGPFRDDTHRAAVEATAVDLAGRPLGESLAGISGGPATSVWSGGRKPASEAPIDVFVCASHAQLLDFGVEHAHLGLNGIYDAATRALSSAGPLPLASNEPWVESDEAYRERLKAAVPDEPHAIFAIVHYGFSEDLEYCGFVLDLPRARLVPATTMQGGSDG